MILLLPEWENLKISLITITGKKTVPGLSIIAAKFGIGSDVCKPKIDKKKTYNEWNFLYQYQMRSLTHSQSNGMQICLKNLGNDVHRNSVL